MKPYNQFQAASVIYAYSPATDNWEKISSMARNKVFVRNGHRGKKVIIAAGEHNNVISARADVYDLVTNKWIQCNSLPKNIDEMPYASIDSSIYIIGGRNDGTPPNIPTYSDVYEGILISSGNFKPDYIKLCPIHQQRWGNHFNFAVPNFHLLTTIHLPIQLH